jgi:hypothetical protein
MKLDDFHLTLTNLTYQVEQLKGKQFPEKDSTISVLEEKLTGAKEALSVLQESFSFISLE